MCTTILDGPEEVKRHMFTAHKNVLLYANPVAVDEWEIGQRAVPKPVIKPQPKKKVEEEEYEDEEDLTLPEDE